MSFFILPPYLEELPPELLKDIVAAIRFGV